MTPRKQRPHEMTADELEQAFERIQQVYDEKVEQERANPTPVPPEPKKTKGE